MKHRWLTLPRMRVSLPVPDPDLPAATVAAPYYPGDALRDSLAKGRQVRILYYGDSQVEGDRVTSLLRKQLREEGGGTGPGLISPVMPVMYTRSYVVRSSSNWKRYTLLDYRKGSIPHNRMGPMLAISRFTPPGDTLEDTLFCLGKDKSCPRCRCLSIEIREAEDILREQL